VSGYIRRGGNLYDNTTGARVGYIDSNGNEQFEQGGGTGLIQLPARIRDLINGPIFAGADRQFNLGFSPASLVPLPGSVETTQYFVSPAGSDSNNGTTWALAKRSINAAITLGNTAAVPYRVNIAAGTTAAGAYDRNQSFTNGATAVIPTQSCRFVAYGGQVICHTGGALTWTLESGTTYQATRSNVGRVIDWLANNQYGDPTGLTLVASLAICRATPGSWYTDNVTVYVTRSDGAVVADANTSALLHNVNGIVAPSSGSMWLEGITQLGGSAGNLRMVNNATGKVYARDCKFLFANEGTNHAAHAVQGQDIGLAVLERCSAAYADNDGFNFHSNAGSVPKAVTVDCLGYENGQWAANVSCNGLTGHDAGAYLDIRGRYTRNHGGDCAFTNPSTVAACIGTLSVNGYGDVDRGGAVPPNSGFHSINTATMYLYLTTGSRLVESAGQFLDLSTL